LPDSFVSCKNASNEPNFIDFGGNDAQLKNYQVEQAYSHNLLSYLNHKLIITIYLDISYYISYISCMDKLIMLFLSKKDTYLITEMVKGMLKPSVLPTFVLISFLLIAFIDL